MNLFRKIQYFFADRILEYKMWHNKLRQYICEKTCGHEWSKPQKIDYDPKTGRKEMLYFCVNCGKVRYKTKRVAKNYGKGNPKLHKWHRYISNI